MHKVYENDDLMMYFKKRYCHCCGNVLQRNKIKRIVRKEDPEHKIYCTIGATYKPHGDIIVVGKEYYCPSCKKSFSCNEQNKVIEAQKKYQRNIVTDEEIADVDNNNMLISNSNILKLKWILLIPVIGGLICMFKIFNSNLSKKTKSKDGTKLMLSSILVFLGVALVVKLVLSMFNIDFINKYGTIIMLIPSLLSFNMPILLYINYMFKK